jgi:hypothetical protein
MKRKPIPNTAALWANFIVNQDLEDKRELQRLLLTIKSEVLSCDNFSEDIKYADYLDEMVKFYRLPHANDTEDNLVDRLKLLLRHVFNDHQLVMTWLEYNGQYIFQEAGSFSLPNSYNQIGGLCEIIFRLRIKNKKPLSVIFFFFFIQY